MYNISINGSLDGIFLGREFFNKEIHYHRIYLWLSWKCCLICWMLLLLPFGFITVVNCGPWVAHFCANSFEVVSRVTWSYCKWWEEFVVLCWHGFRWGCGSFSVHGIHVGFSPYPTSWFALYFFSCVSCLPLLEKVIAGVRSWSARAFVLCRSITTWSFYFPDVFPDSFQVCWVSVFVLPAKVIQDMDHVLRSYL